ncbi:MAG: nuclear transport factor 2 family protein [Deltaproteobacteria bacterium]|nr:nuclear transport factor 2 family protein [Deltaproteobacteria bacterium]
MAKWSREEIEQAFHRYEEAVARCAKAVDWDEWCNLFTEDAEYHDDVWPMRRGAKEIADWMRRTFSAYPQNQMREFPTEWYIIDEDRGWVVCEFQNRMVDPGDGKIYQQKNYARLKYAGNDKWSFQEDQYNPAAFQSMLQDWLKAKG